MCSASPRITTMRSGWLTGFAPWDSTVEPPQTNIVFVDIPARRGGLARGSPGRARHSGIDRTAHSVGDASRCAAGEASKPPCRHFANIQPGAASASSAHGEPSENRPDPDALLAKVQRQEAAARRGKLRIYFGSSAGVGKTYAMLLAARKLKSEGRDVVVGIVETHGRAETASLAREYGGSAAEG